MQEQEFIRLATEGDRAAFNTLAEGCAEMIYGLAYRLTGNASDAEDLAQDAFVSAFRNLQRFERRSTFASWVYRITVNLWKNRVKYEKRRFFLRHFSLDRLFETEDDEMPVQVASGEPDPLASMEQADETQAVQAVLDRLSAEERSLIVLCDIEEKSYQEIAELLQCPLGTVKSRIARARDALRKEWLRSYEMPGA